MRTRAAWLLAVVMVLGGCPGGPAPQNHYYRLDLPDSKPRFDLPPLNGTLLVTRPWADALTSERNLLYRQNSGPSRLRRHTRHRWVDSPTQMLQQEIARYLRGTRIADRVVTPELRTNVDYLLSCRIVNLERVLDGSPRVLMELELGITRMRDRHPLVHQTYRQEQEANDNGVDASIFAYNQALTTILDRFLADSSGLAQEQEMSPSP